jgi:superfamily I DNA and/or RNA helicase/DNA polymerase IIIc chi subunit
MIPILKSYLKRLTNLSSRNKSLLLLKDSMEQFLDLHQFDFLNNKPSYDIVNQLIADKKSIFLCDEIDPRFEKVNELSKRLRRVARTEKFIEQERGSEDLYVGYPFVKGKLLDGTVVRCPLLFFPVTLKLDRQKWTLVKRESEQISFNRSFLLAYSHFNNTKISDDFLEKNFEDFSKESLPFRTALYEFLKESPLIINFNQELFSDQLQHFDKLLKSDLDLNEKNGELKLQQQAVLGIFPQAGSFLVPDYEMLIETDTSDSIENDTVEKQENTTNKLHEIFASKAKIIDFETIKEEKILAPFAMDASQEIAIKKVNAGQSIVIQGPPGTGKSQLICNLIADFSAAGKKVLVVCQKRAALDVVYQRLGSVGFQDFAAVVHDFKNDRKTLFNQIANQIGLVETYKKQNHSLDAIRLEDDFNQTSRQIDRLAGELDEFKAALFNTDQCGITVKDMYLSSNINEPTIDLSSQYKYFKKGFIESFSSQLLAYGAYLVKLKSLNQFWKNRVDFKQFQINDLNIAKKIITEIPNETTEISKYFSEQFDLKLDWPKYLKIKSDKNLIEYVINLSENEQLWHTAQYLNGFKNYLAISNNLFTLENKSYSFFDEPGLETTLASNELENALKIVSEAKTANENFVSGTVYSFFSNHKITVKALIAINGLSFTKVDLEKLTIRIQNRINLEEWMNKNVELFGNNIQKNEWQKTGKKWFEGQFYDLKASFELLSVADRITSIAIKSLLKTNHNAANEKLKVGIKFVEKLSKTDTNWAKYLTTNQINSLFCNPELAQNAKQELENNFDLFYEADMLKSKFSHSEWAVIEAIEKNETASDPQKMLALFQNSIKLAWINDIEEKYPILRSVSSLKMAQLEQDLQEKIIHKQTLSQQILLIKSREHTYNNLETNRLNNVTTYRELLHQVTKKKKLCSVRQLVSSYSEEIFDLVPCWLASPETVSAVFPMQQFFDLVIFDEASQCYAESGIPAIYRGKQCVITGDSKQLQPSDLYQVRYEDEADEQPELEVDSLLDLAIQHLPQNWLHGHYRSHSIDLIDFSNRYFYKEKLQLLPHFQEINKNEPGIKFIKVNGTFTASTNEVEADEVVALVKSLKQTDPTKSIGIVTFNYKQQSLIQDKLEGILADFDQNIENTFVKNIENVQGDERDIIIFSIGYGKDQNGKMKMAFGSLNQAGGGNRLNVAITRARNKIFVISSIYSNELHVDDTLNDGPKLLKKYMEFAQNVSEGTYKPRTIINEKFATGGLLKDYLKAENKSLSSELPFSDLVKIDENGYGNLTLTDDDLFFQSLSAKESHAYWPINFNKKGWAFSKTYSREYWKNKR